jgi:NAD(P)-dependent dehydrogenase (short-subunit alcohol dehydrogenase family)
MVGGHLYMQTNEVRNCVVHYRRGANGAITEVERTATSGAGSGTFKPISGQESAPNAFEGAGSVILSPVFSPCDGRDEGKLQSAAAEIGGTSGKVRVLAGDISSPATGAALVESAERHFGGLDKFDSGTRWPSFTTQGGGR